MVGCCVGARDKSCIDLYVCMSICRCLSIYIDSGVPAVMLEEVILRLVRLCVGLYKILPIPISYGVMAYKRWVGRDRALHSGRAMVL